MSEIERRPIPDGRIRITRLLTERQKQALIKLKTEGLVMLNQREVHFKAPETWVEYWFDKTMISEQTIRLEIHNALNEN